MMKKWLYRNSRPLTAAACLSAQLQSAQRPMPVAQPQDQQHRRTQSAAQLLARDEAASAQRKSFLFFFLASCCMGFKPLSPLFFLGFLLDGLCASWPHFFFGSRGGGTLRVAEGMKRVICQGRQDMGVNSSTAAT